ncbi:uncharacterized protein LOC118469151 isoform X2 [Amphiprion ocellaris]|uniref:uncharacterized protein LOC118469151 isoform X2 n=1 Tax=Amphiprion ocellaris TaxID=80972 RepID=UPI002411896A|nr:uncharacterized protein LOC118469151 isoform X2 [Amphiprion ocellaris]
MEHPTFRRAPNGTLLLKASPEAQALGPRQAGYRARPAQEVEEEARAHIVSEGGDVTNAILVLSRWRVQFGRYQGQTFHWLLENDVGYAVNLLAGLQSASRAPDPFFACRLFQLLPHRIWRLQLTCPQPSCTGSMTIRRVLDIDGWSLMATEYLECCRCTKKVVGWSQGIIRQLPHTYSCQFPAILMYRLSCDLRVVAQLKSRTLGNSATQLCNTLRETHTDSWMRRAIHYLGVCEQFLALGSVRWQFPPTPQMPPLPSLEWLLTVYGYDVLMRLEEYKARITSTFGSIIKMDSTKNALSQELQQVSTYWCSTDDICPRRWRQ